MPTAAALVAAAGVVLAHLLAGHLRRLSYAPRSRALSFAAGVSLAFVFLELLPLLEGPGGAETHGLPPLAPYGAALAAFVLYYGIEHALRRRVEAGVPGSSTRLFAVGVGSFAVLSFVGGHLLLDEARSVLATLLLGAALALKFLVADRGLLERHEERYHKQGRWLLAGAFLAGAVAGECGLPARVITLLAAVLSGGVILTVIKEELPSERDARWRWHLAGAGAYSALFLAAAALR